MPWKERTLMEERYEFIAEWLDGNYASFDELCASYGISPKTGYKWVGRFKEEGLVGLCDRRRGCVNHPAKTNDRMVGQIVALKQHKPRWGAKKIHASLERQGWKPPAVSTVGEILKREGLIKPRKKRGRSRSADFSSFLSEQDQPNAVWAVDFKGWFKLTSGLKCYPLTVSDGYSRYLLGCEALQHPDEISCKAVFESLFAQYGLPDVIRSDNGTPFSGSYGLSSLSIWWVKLGIRPERIQRGRPDQNGRHERMHRTLKDEGIEPRGFQHYQQQRVFNRFRREYNEERPHESIGQRPPAELYVTSSKNYPIKPVSPSYPDDWQIFKVHHGGAIELPERTLQLSPLLRGEPVGVQLREDGSQRVCYGPIVLGNLSRTGKFTRGTRTKRRSRDDELEELTG